IGGDRVSGFGVFVEWGGGLNPTREKETHRLAGDGTRVLPGDVDDDGDLDLVVLDPTLGGVHVLKNSGIGQPTAVMTAAGAVPAQYWLGDSYPNPFNPAVVIPLGLATDAEGVSLTVYDVLGRRVRQVWQGSLRAGVHRFTWDGRDEMARDVAAGVYLYRIEVDGRVETKKMMKLP
ncbi:MAG: T9SS type A sorting domain-containing protein, partial [Gemmatimonadota bacterium]|nr:T9SS type A sorting domain-containing protein [Gemmatimonadota bacterium]